MAWTAAGAFVVLFAASAAASLPATSGVKLPKKARPMSTLAAAAWADLLEKQRHDNILGEFFSMPYSSFRTRSLFDHGLLIRKYKPSQVHYFNFNTKKKEV